MIEIKEIEQNSANEIIINKSKFFAHSFIVHNIIDVDKNIEFLKQKYPDATHICYAYSIYPNLEKAFDDAEPQGTAGKPILDCIKKSGYQNILIAIVRYFGGIKLGAGGLVRAYSGGASKVISNSGSKIATECKNFCFELLLTESKFLQVIKKLNLKKIDITYNSSIKISAYCMVDDLENIKNQIKNIVGRNVVFKCKDGIFFI